MTSRTITSVVFAFVLAVMTAGQVAAAPAIELQPGDHVCLIGNTLAERMQHHGWIESLLHSRFPKHQLVIRNLGYPGDELTLRLRSDGFGSPDDHLTHSKADVVLAFFGYNESFAGAEGLDKFKSDLTAFVQHTLQQKYNGKSAPRIVLFSPLAFEDLRNRNLPDGSEHNIRLEMYTAAIAAVARDQKVGYADLFTPSRQLYRTAARASTINGVHLSAEGERAIAPMLVERLVGGVRATDAELAKLTLLRSAVLDKNFYWFHRYRAVDGYSTYGGRADLKFVNDQTNRVVMQRELEVLDTMTANRDRRIWAAAEGKDVAVDDSNLPAFIPVITNKPGPGPNGEHLFLSGEAGIEKMQVYKGLKVELFASEEMFPELANPVQMAFDTRGRLWVAVMPSYPHWKPTEKMDDKILILEDTNNDGRADVCKTFASGLHVPTGMEFWNGGLIVGLQPDLVFFKDTDGDDRADISERILTGFDSADTHHAINSFVIDPGGALYMQEGTFHHTQVETPWGGPVRCANAGVYRFEPRNSKLDVFVSYGFANPHGHVFDRWGQNFITDGTGNQNYFAAAFSGHMEFPNKHSGYQPFYQQRTRPCPGTEFLSSRHFPEEIQGAYLDANVIGIQGILQYRVKDAGSGFGADELEPFLLSSDPSFRPTDLEVAPDGSLYMSDWQNPIIGHMQHNLRDPSRDRTHGRVYRIYCPDRPLLTPPTIAGAPIAAVLDELKSPEDRARYRARIELSGRNTTEIVAAAKPWLANLNKSDADYEHHVLEALWLHQSHNVVDVALLQRVLASPEPRARAAATRVLCYWRDRVSNTLDLLRKLADDEHPRVRLEAVRAASFLTAPEAFEVVYIAARKPSDYFLDYVKKETLRTLDPIWKSALAAGKKVPVQTPEGAAALLQSMSVEQLLAAERTLPVCLELLNRPGVRDEDRVLAVTTLAKQSSRPELAIILDALRNIDGQQSLRDESVIFDLVRLLTSRNKSELTAVRDELAKLAATARSPIIRQISMVAMISVDGSVENVWSDASQSLPKLQDLVSAVPLMSDATLRAAMYPKVLPLVDKLPDSLVTATSSRPATIGRFIRIEIPRKNAVLTLAEVEVFSESKNVALSGKAKQSSTAHGGVANRAIDGNRIGSYGSNGQTHTNEGDDSPWWELDLGADYPIEAVNVFNRTDGDLGSRLKGFTIAVLDAQRNVTFTKADNPAPASRAVFEMNGDGAAGALRRAAMTALVSVRGKEAETFRTLAARVAVKTDRLSAIRALQRVPRTEWQADLAAPLLDQVLTYVRTIPTTERTTPAAVDALEFAEALSTLLPADQAKIVRTELGDLGVRVIRIGTILEKMSYDKELIVVRAGKPVEFVFENNDLMPHNLVILKPGMLEPIGQQAEATATAPESAARQYVPVSDAVLLGSRLLQPRETQTLSFTVPTEPGIYPYVCTYPGHWRRMYGALYVVADLEGYLVNPEAYLAANPLPVADELLKDRRPRTEWKLEDLMSEVVAMKNGRSYSSGKHLFQVASCISCHKMDGEGKEFGPNLAELDAKKTPADILKSVIDPSAEIEAKYQQWVFENKAGKTLSGLIVEETNELVRLVENPLASTVPVELKISEIEERTRSAVSIMPKGLLDKLTRDEILDLLAYVIARGNSQHALFAPAHDHAAAGHKGRPVAAVVNVGDVGDVSAVAGDKPADAQHGHGE